MACRNSLMGGGRVGLDGHEQWRSVGVVCSLHCCSQVEGSASSLLLPNEDTHASRRAARGVLGPPCLLAALLEEVPQDRYLWPQHVIVKAYTHHTALVLKLVLCSMRTKHSNMATSTAHRIVPELSMLEPERPLQHAFDHAVSFSHTHLVIVFHELVT